MPRSLSPELMALLFSLILSLGLATFGVAQDALSPKPGAVQHAMPPGGYPGAARSATVLVSACPTGAGSPCIWPLRD